ncbi:MAG: hypothetical protein M0Z39_01600 [Actinomycetota bacterium]|nr:hypothetical protein [Actinomycetota bacterium]
MPIFGGGAVTAASSWTICEGRPEAVVGTDGVGVVPGADVPGVYVPGVYVMTILQ